MQQRARLTHVAQDQRMLQYSLPHQEVKPARSQGQIVHLLAGIDHPPDLQVQPCRPSLMADSQEVSVQPVGEHDLVPLPTHRPCSVEAVEHIISFQDSTIQVTSAGT